MTMGVRMNWMLAWPGPDGQRRRVRSQVARRMKPSPGEMLLVVWGPPLALDLQVLQQSQQTVLLTAEATGMVD